jgi:hypothetical protein
MDAEQGTQPEAKNNPEAVQSQTGTVSDLGGSGRTDKSAEPHKPSVHWPYVWGTIIGAFALIGGLSGFYTVAHWVEGTIDKSVERKLSDPSILRKIAAESRPLLIFNGNESYLTDEGASQFIKEFKITARQSMGTTNLSLPSHIHIEFTKFLSSAILTPLSENLCVATGSRGKGLSWEFKIQWVGITMEDAGTNDAAQLFRLELLP